jgi:hypothetical protein
MQMLRVLKWIGLVLGGLIALIVIAGLVLYVIGQGRVNGKVSVPIA